MRQLNSDELGRKGEARFEELCHDAGLIPNKSNLDRTGWDFLVEWPNAKNASYSLDRRPAPISCLVQVKSVWIDTKNIKARLSSVERLVKEPRPCFVIILKFDSDLNLVGLRVVHVRKEFSSNVLKKLRTAHLEGLAANKQNVSFAISKWASELEPTGDGFRSYVESVMLESLADYGLAKTKELSGLGIEDGSFTIEAKFIAKTAEEILDGLLGLHPLQGSISNAMEKRFGISLPLTELPDAEGVIKFQPEAECKCNILVRRDNRDDPLVFESDMFTLPPAVASAGVFKALFKTSLFNLLFRFEQNGEATKIDLSIKVDNEVITTARLPASEWCNFYSLMEHFSNGSVILELLPDNGNPPIVGTISANNPKENGNSAKYLKRLSEIMKAAAARAGEPKMLFEISELIANDDQILVLGELLENSGKLTPWSFTTELTEAAIEGMEQSILYIAHFSIGESILAYCCDAQVSCSIEIDVCRWTEQRMELVSVRRIAPNQPTLDQYVSAMQEQTKIRSFFAATFQGK